MSSRTDNEQVLWRFVNVLRGHAIRHGLSTSNQAIQDAAHHWIDSMKVKEQSMTNDDGLV